MRLFLKFVLPAVGLVLGAGSLVAESKPTKPKESEKKNSKKKDAKKDDAKPAGPQKLSFPVPVGHDSKGLKLPTYGPDGKLQMLFTIGLANRIDDQNVDLKDLQVDTYNADESPELSIGLPVGSFNLATHILSTRQEVVIRRDDFELTGKTMEFNTDTREGRLGGGVKMIIFNLDTGEEPVADPSAEPPTSLPGGLPKVSFPGDGAKPTINVKKPQTPPAAKAPAP